MTEHVTTPDGRPGFWSLVREDWESHQRDWTKPGFRALFAYRVGAHRQRTKVKGAGRVLRWLSRRLQRRVRWRHGIELHDTTTVGRRVRFPHGGGVIIHRHAVIGDDCMIRQGVTLGSGISYDKDDAPVLERNVKIGAGAKIVGKITLGEGCRVGPNAVVTRNVPAGALVVAPQSRVIAFGGAAGARQAGEAPAAAPASGTAEAQGEAAEAQGEAAEAQGQAPTAPHTGATA